MIKIYLFISPLRADLSSLCRDLENPSAAACASAISQSHDDIEGRSVGDSRQPDKMSAELEVRLQQRHILIKITETILLYHYHTMLSTSATSTLQRDQLVLSAAELVDVRVEYGSSSPSV